jgi:hypothetical protein
MHTRRLVLLAMVFAMACLAPAPLRAASRLTFTRTVPPPHDLHGAKHLVFIYALGDSDRIRDFVDSLTSLLSRSEFFAVDDVTERSQHLFGAKPGDPQIKALHKHHPADLYLGVTLFTCDSVEKSSEGTARTESGRESVTRHWTEARCSTRVDVMDGTTMKRQFSLHVRGDGTSVPSATPSPDDHGHALDEAARHTAIAAAEMITPRRVREAIELDDSAARFDEANSWLDAGQLDRAREVFEAVSHNGSAAAHFDLAAVCEALEDLDCAQSHYEQAQKLAPHDERFRAELRRFHRRVVDGHAKP